MEKIKKLFTISVSLILLFNLGACAEKETDLSQLNPDIIHPQRTSFTTKEETNAINDFLHDIQLIDIPLYGWEATRNLEEKLKKSTYNNGVYTLTTPYDWNYMVSDSYLVITTQDHIPLTYSIFDARKEIVAYNADSDIKSSYVETSAHIEYAISDNDLIGEKFYRIELHHDGGYAISWTHFTEYGINPVKEIFNKDGYLKEVELETGVKATRLFGEYTMQQGELIDSQGKKVMEGVSYRALQYPLRGISLENCPWVIIVDE